MINILLTIICIVLCADFWRRGGDGSPIFRKIGVPTVIALTKFFMTGFNPLLILYMPLLWAMIQIFSYGLGSPIHDFWEWVFKKGEAGDSYIVEWCTRATCGFLWSLPGAIFAIVSGYWLTFVFYTIFLTLANGFIGAGVEDVEISERLVGGSVALSVLI